MVSAPVRQLVRWLDELGKISDEQAKLTRTFLSPAMRRANSRVAEWMRASGLTVREDAVGNLIGRVEAIRATRNEAGNKVTRGSARGFRSRAKTLLLGSHLDTVRDAGRFDGALGVLLPIVALQELRSRGIMFPFAVEMVGFSEEEGVRFASAYLGSKGYAGQLRARDLALRDVNGVSVREALEHDQRGKFAVPRAAHRPDELLGYLEVHIEQGPVLEAEGLAVGIVSRIAGQTRGRFTFRGKAGHAGTTPMPLRRDSLAGAAELVLFIEKLARDRPPLVATVGTLAVHPGAPNVIPGEAAISLDLRHPRDADRVRAVSQVRAAAAMIARRRRLTCDWLPTQDDRAIACSPALIELLDACARTVQGRSISLVSGAGHDAVAMSALTPVAMLFVRCRDGLSHHPDESTSPADIAVALEVTVAFIEQLARAYDATGGSRAIPRTKSR